VVPDSHQVIYDLNRKKPPYPRRLFLAKSDRKRCLKEDKLVVFTHLNNYSLFTFETADQVLG